MGFGNEIGLHSWKINLLMLTVETSQMWHVKNCCISPMTKFQIFSFNGVWELQHVQYKKTSYRSHVQFTFFLTERKSKQV